MTEPWQAKRGERGLFLAGTKGGPGRKPGRPDLYLLAEKMAERDGYDLREAIWIVTKKMLELGAKGDIQAAKLALDHLCMPARHMLEVTGLDESPLMSQMTIEEIERRVASLISMAHARAAAAEASKVSQNGHANPPTPPALNG